MKTVAQYFLESNQSTFQLESFISGLVPVLKGNSKGIASALNASLREYTNPSEVQQFVMAIAAIDFAASIRIYEQFEKEYLDLLQLMSNLMDQKMDTNLKKQLVTSKCNLILSTKIGLKSAIPKKAIHHIYSLLKAPNIDLVSSIN